MSSNAVSNYRGELGPYDWDWTFLNNSFDRGIRVGDLDGFVEVNNNFLIIEGKSRNGSLPRGQKMALQRLAKMDNVTVIVLMGNPPDEVYGWEILGKQTSKGNKEDFQRLIRRWFNWADKKDK